MTDASLHEICLQIRAIYEVQIDDKCLRRLKVVYTKHIKELNRYHVESYLLEEFT